MKNKLLGNHKLNISRQCSSQLLRFNTKRNEIIEMPNGSYIVAPKRNHWIAKYGRFIVSFGGVNDLGRVLEDIDIYDTEFGGWQPAQLKNNIEGVWYSTFKAIYYPDRYDENYSKIEIDNLPTPNWGRVVPSQTSPLCGLD